MIKAKTSLILILFLVSIFYYSESSYGRIREADESYLPKNTITIIRGTKNIVNLFSHLQVTENNYITIPYELTYPLIFGVSYQVENAEQCLKKIKDLVAPNTSYSSLEVKKYEDNKNNQALQFILEWKYWDKTESVVCPLKFNTTQTL